MKFCVYAAFVVGTMYAAPLSFSDTQAATSPAISAQNPLAIEMNVARGAREIASDLQTTSAELGRSVPSQQSMVDPTVRTRAADGATPVLWRMIHLLDEAAASPGISPQSKPDLIVAKYHYLGVLCQLDDDAAEKELDGDAASTQKEVALPAATARLTAKWVKNYKESDVQREVLNDLEKIVKGNPTSNTPALAAFTMYQLGAASPDLRDRAKHIALEESTSSFAKQQQKRLSDEAKLAALENKPLDIKGTSLDGAAFSSTSYNGKVILVDFWATWCGPCKAELPRVKNLYKRYHEQGLEIVGVSCDVSGDALKDFIKADPDMSWMELYEPGSKTNPLVVQYGIDVIPRMLLIDRNGVCRTVEAREKMEQLVPVLLAEKASGERAAAIEGIAIEQDVFTCPAVIYKGRP